MDRALRADLGRCLAERGHGHGFGVAADDPRRVRLLPPVQLRVLRVQVLLAFLAVGDPRGCHRPVDHHPDPLVPVLADRARIPVRAGDIIAAPLAGRAQVQVRLGQQPHELEPRFHRLALQLLMLQGQRLLAPGPGDHRLRVCARRGEQRLLRVLVPGCFPRNSLVCNAGAHGHRLLLRVSWNAAKNRGGGFPVQAPQRSSPPPRSRGPRASLPPAQTPGTHHRYVPICQDTPVTPGSSPIRPERPPVLEPHPCILAVDTELSLSPMIPRNEEYLRPSTYVHFRSLEPKQNCAP